MFGWMSQASARVNTAGAMGLDASSAASGLTFNRLFDLSALTDPAYARASGLRTTIISDKVFGLDASLPLAMHLGSAASPAAFAAIATSRYGSAAQPAANDTAAVAGVKFKLLGGDAAVAFQSVGGNLVAAVPFQPSGQTPALFAFYNFSQLPAPFGIGADLPVSRPLDDTVASPNYRVPAAQNSGSSPFGGFAFPLFDAAQAQTPLSFSADAPTARGTSVQLNFPFMISNVSAKMRLGGRSFSQTQPNSLATQIFGSGFASSVSGKFKALSGGVTLALPLFDRKATVSLDGLYEQLTRNDKTPSLYAANTAFLGDPATVQYDQLAVGALGAGRSSAVYFYPNFTDVRHFLGSASVAVPVSSALTVNGSYYVQRYNGEGLNTLTQGLTERKRALSGGVLYNIPNSNSSVNLFFNKYRYTDDLVPTHNFTENRQNLYFSVKF
ncbi:MAG: hypothetical protein DLM53_01870 [Candidatus Eremiobacter antarcticus]|nr:MAG: hypothetical protein DLM53_01870 [Candidatus Eremiobacter sp. RRmetagenome_bin22]